MAFHCGVLRWLAETRRLEDITQVSSVSGGTLVVGLMLSSNNWTWPSSRGFLQNIAPALRDKLTKKDVARTATLLLLVPSNWRYLLSRANVLSRAIERSWEIRGCLSDLPAAPAWSINGTTAETGRRFRFKRDGFGDYELGYASAGTIKIADAMAMSAALPGFVGPLSIVPSHYQWTRRPRWDAPAGSEVQVTLPYRRLHLYDGGLYDNLALESLMDAGTQRLKTDIKYLVCSDAGAVLKRVDSRGPLSPFRALRILNIALDQSRALRVRALMNSLGTNAVAGTYAQIGSIPEEGIRRFEDRKPIATLLNYDWLSSEQIAQAANHPTTLRPLSETQFDRLERHGYESIRWNELLFRGAGLLQSSIGTP